MPIIYLETYIKSLPTIVFDLSRSIELHKASMTHHREDAIDGTTKGLMNKGDTVTWTARHLLRNRKLKVCITDLARPEYFSDEMVKGDFKTMRHQHYFKTLNEGTLMIDKFYFESPFGILGKIFDKVYLTQYMTRLLEERNKEIKRIAETDLWKQYLHQ